MDDMRSEAEKLASEHPEQEEEIKGRLAEIQDVWEELRATMKRREESLGEASKLSPPEARDRTAVNSTHTLQQITLTR